MVRHRQPPSYVGRHRAPSAGLHRVVAVGAALVVITTAGVLAVNARGVDAPAAQPVALDISSEGSGLVPSGEIQESGPVDVQSPDPTPPGPTTPVAFDRNCTIINLDEPDVEPPVRDVACMLKSAFPGIVMTIGRAKALSGHENGLAFHMLADAGSIQQIEQCARRHLDDWHLRTVATTGDAHFHLAQQGDNPDGKDHVYVALRDASPIAANTLVC